MKSNNPTGSLRDYIHKYAPASADEFLELARALAARVEALHRRQILHLDLRPERIAIPANSREADLIDTGLSVRRTVIGYAHTAGQGIPDAGMPYCSPENTGRMQRTVDERSDLYSLGVIFYELLTGQLPFSADNPLEWVYKHLAQSPKPLRGHPAKLPDGLEAIVMKLLEKNPDNRYPNAGFLLADLDKIGRLPDTLHPKPGIQGREHELAELTQAFFSACFGSAEIVYVSGEPGIGKTSLIEEMFINQRHKRDFYYITGKFEQISRESPYHPLIQAFRGLMRHLLGGRKEQSEQWGSKLRSALGVNAHVIADIIPEVGLLLGSMPVAEELPANDAKKRFVYIFRKFVQSLASKEHPLVLFIDDLQWADSSSLQLIHALLCDPECQYLLFVCAYRPAETDRSKLPGYEPDGSVAEQAIVRHIHLSPLGLEHLNRIVTETLHSRSENMLSLTELLYHQSGGNPFHFKQILLRLLDDRILLYDQELRRWQWNVGQIIEREPDYAIHDLMTHRIERLSEDAQRLLHVAACMGSVFRPGVVAAVAGRQAEDGLAVWSEIEAAGLILPIESNRFRFSHDSVQKLIYSRMDDAVRSSAHYPNRPLHERAGID